MEPTRRNALAMMSAAGAVLGAPAQAQAPKANSKMKFWAACTTPCDKNMKVDLGAMKDQVEWFKGHGADGITFLGSTGEFASFTLAERKSIMEVVGKAKGNLTVLCTSGTANFADTIELSKHAADHGADGVIVLPPYYVKGPSTEGLLRYYAIVMDAMPKSLAFYLYHVPRWSTVPIPIELVKSLKRYTNLAGIKDSTSDAKGYTNFITNFPEMNVITGAFENLEIALTHGMGGIIQEAGPYCRELADLFAVARSGKDVHGPYTALQQKIAGLYGSKDGLDGYGIMQYAMTVEMGKPASYQRPPFTDLTTTRKAEIEKYIRAGKT
jgi:4-hydroxy-tetrahydrodipicolinate synthase